MGGTLPFSEPGPSLQEVFRQYLPFITLALTILFGPQLAVKLRIAGIKSAKAGGKIYYRLVMGGILVGLLFALYQWAITASSGIQIQLILRKGLLITSIVLYLVGFALLFLATYQSKLPSSDNSDLLELGALFFPLLFVPIAIMLVIPVPMGNITASWLLPLGEIVWVIATILVVKD
jgi:cytochrome c biogenesis factor